MSRFNHRYIMLIILLGLLLVLLTGCETHKNIIPPSTLTGYWIGLGSNQLSNEFLNQREIPAFLSISNKGQVTGYIGDADIVAAPLQAPAWWAKWFKKYKYIVTFKLSGNLVNRESFTRDGGTLVINSIDEDGLNCTFISTGSQVSSKNMILEVKNLKLHHPQ